MVLSPNQIDENSNPGLASDGTTHPNTKLPHESKKLAKSLIYLLSNLTIKPNDVDTSTWEETFNKYH